MDISDEAKQLLAHSAPCVGVPADAYARHVEGVRRGACERAEAMLAYAGGEREGLLKSIETAAIFHDLGKVDEDNQSALRVGRGGKLIWDHIDAGVAHVSASQNWMAAWLIRAHHAPGLPEKQEHFNPDGIGRRLRGLRHDTRDQREHEEQIERTNSRLSEYLERHNAAVGESQIVPSRPLHGLAMRLALSCLVDADHSDTAHFDTGRMPLIAPAPRWSERLIALRKYVSLLPIGASEAERVRNQRRTAFFEGCLNSSIDTPLVACEAPVGIGKTTAVSAYLIKRCLEGGLRRLIIVAPYTNILTQTAKILRRALVLPDEIGREREVVAEHHHRADFESREDRELAALWRAPVVLTTAVGFFEALAACRPGSLRKLHALVGSAIFIDEAHAALPVSLWPQNWRWLKELASEWSCRVVFASGSLTRFWEHKEIVGESTKLPELLPTEGAPEVFAAERRRVRYSRTGTGNVLTIAKLIEHVQDAAGPRLVILNTVQSAAVVARAMKSAGLDTKHVSTALTPDDREAILRGIEGRLKNTASTRDWVLVATSCLEAGVDLSFRSAFRERFSVASTIQVGGRVNRHSEYDVGGGSIVFDFALADDGIKSHPAAEVSSDILRELMLSDSLNTRTPSDVVTDAMLEELTRRGGLGANALLKCEQVRDYPEVQELGRVIVAGTQLVVVDDELKHRLSGAPIIVAGRRLEVPLHDLLGGSVQIWARKIEALRLERLPGRRDIYAWHGPYDSEFLGYMAGVLENEEFRKAGGAVV